MHPGELLGEILSEMNLSQAGFSRMIDVAPMRVSHIVNGTRPVTAELALLFGKIFGQTPQFWLNLQSTYDLRIAEKRMASRLKAMPKLKAA